MAYFLLFNLLLVGTFSQKWYIDRGTLRGYGRINVADTDHDGRIELIFGTYDAVLRDRVVIYELGQGDTFAFRVVVDSFSNEIWAAGDFDNDNKTDLVLTGQFGLPVVGPQIYESMNHFAYPTIEVWRDTAGTALVLPICVYDIDQDGLPEIVKNRVAPYGDIGIYESIGDNQYDMIFSDDLNEAPAATIAFGDFDGDGRIEFIPAGGNESYWVYECTRNNTYKRIIDGQLPTLNIRDCFSVADADSDGKPEFVIKGRTVPNGKFQVFIFEAIGNNSYAIVDTFNFFGFGGGYYGGYSATGDVDGDGLPEIALEGSYRVYMIEADGNDNFYVFDTLPGNSSGSQIAIYDIDGNGLSEVIISGNNETRIYEYVAPVIEEKRKVANSHPKILISPNPFTIVTRIDFIGISDHQNIRESELHIYDASGRLVKSAKLSTSTYQLGADFVPGIYFLKLNGKPVGKVVKVR